MLNIVLRIKVESESGSVMSALRDPMDYSPPDSSVHGILQARILEWVAMPSSRGSSWPRDWTQVSSIAGRFFTIWDMRKAQSGLYKCSLMLSLTLDFSNVTILINFLSCVGEHTQTGLALVSVPSPWIHRTPFPQVWVWFRIILPRGSNRGARDWHWPPNSGQGEVTAPSSLLPAPEGDSWMGNPQLCMINNAQR